MTRSKLASPEETRRTINRSPKRRLLRIILGAVLIMAGWYFLENVQKVGAGVLGCTYQAEDKAAGTGTCFGISTSKMRATEGIGAALVLAGIAAAAGAVGFSSKA